MKKTTLPTICFSVKLTDLADFIVLPKSVSDKVEGINIEGIIGSLPFRSKIQKDKKGNMQLILNASMKTAIKRNGVKDISIEITRIGDEIETRIPAELRKVLDSAPKAKAVWDDITPIARRDWIFWIITGKLAETRLKRIETAISKLSSGMRRVCCFPGINWLMKNG